MCFKQNSKLRLLIIGEGKEENRLKKLAKELGLENEIKFTGRIPFKQISENFNKADVLVNISEYESFGVSVIEAMSCGKPVIVTDVGGLAEIVENESVGIKVEVRNIDQAADAMFKLSSDKILYNTISQNGRQLVFEKYNWKNNLSNMISIYKRTLELK